MLIWVVGVQNMCVNGDWARFVQSRRLWHILQLGCISLWVNVLWAWTVPSATKPLCVPGMYSQSGIFVNLDASQTVMLTLGFDGDPKTNIGYGALCGLECCNQPLGDCCVSVVDCMAAQVLCELELCKQVLQSARCDYLDKMEVTAICMSTKWACKSCVS
jgi:hypothetical protein